MKESLYNPEETYLGNYTTGWHGFAMKIQHIMFFFIEWILWPHKAWKTYENFTGFSWEQWRKIWYLDMVFNFSWKLKQFHVAISSASPMTLSVLLPTIWAFHFYKVANTAVGFKGLWNSMRTPWKLNDLAPIKYPWNWRCMKKISRWFHDNFMYKSIFLCSKRR